MCDGEGDRSRRSEAGTLGKREEGAAIGGRVVGVAPIWAGRLAREGDEVGTRGCHLGVGCVALVHPDLPKNNLKIRFKTLKTLT